MRLALDTNRYTDFAKGDAETVRRIETAYEVFIPLIVLGEIRAGFASGSRSNQNERALLEFLQCPGVHILHPDENTTHQYARLFGQLRRQGTPIPTNDIWIAALVIQHELTLLTRDAHFQHLPQVPTV